MNYSLVACDLDGTLLDDHSHVSKDSFSAIHQMTEEGVEFVLCTGRTFYEIPAELRAFPEIRYYIYSDGAVVYDKKEGKFISTHYFPTETLCSVVQLLTQFDTMIEVYDDGHPKGDADKLNKQTFAYYNVEQNYWDVMEQTRIGLSDFAQQLRSLQHAEIINVFFRDPAERDACFSLLQQRTDVSFTTSMDNNIEIMLPEVSKGNALLTLTDYLGVAWQKTMAVGDSRNDLSMFAIAGISVASGSADRQIRQIAGFTTCSNNDSVPQYILTHYLKGEEFNAG